MAKLAPVSGAPVQSRPGVEIRALTGLRIVAAVWVMLFHLQGGLLPFAAYLGILWPVVRAGWLGVDLFFLLSGFVMTLSYLEKMGPRFEIRRVGIFMWARLCRIWPLWALLTVLFGIWLAWTAYDAGLPAERRRVLTIWSMLEQLALVQMWHRPDIWSASFVRPGWSLSVEFLAYVCFPVLVLVLWRMRRLPAAVLGLAAVALMVPLAVVSYRLGTVEWAFNWGLRIGGAFVSGGLVCLFVRRVQHSESWRRVSPYLAVLSVVVLVVLCWWAGVRGVVAEGDYFGVAVPVFPVLVASLALSRSGVARMLSRDAMVTGGKISFALYLVHDCLIEITIHVTRDVAWLQPEEPAWLLVQVHLIAVSLLFAGLLYRYVEEPSRLFLRRIGPQEGRARAARLGATITALPLVPVVAEPATVRIDAVASAAGRAALRRPLPHPGVGAPTVPRLSTVSTGT